MQGPETSQGRESVGGGVSSPNLEEMRALPECQLADVFTVGDDWQGDELESISAYLRIFHAPVDGLTCRGCEHPLGGMLGTFTWGMVHGEGVCSKCGLPTRMYHRVKHDGEEVLTFTLPLQYHASGLSTEASA